MPSWNLLCVPAGLVSVTLEGEQGICCSGLEPGVTTKNDSQDPAQLLGDPTRHGVSNRSRRFGLCFRYTGDCRGPEGARL